MRDVSSRIANLTPKQRALLELRRGQSASAPAAAEPIAIVGIGCRFPGGVTDPDSFWNLLRDGVDAITEVPSDRWDIDAYYDPNPETPGKMYTRWGGFLNGVDQFDARFFGIAPREAMSMDPQQRLLLEVSWEALEHAGLPPDRLTGTKTGVFIGMMTNDYSQLNLVGHDPAQMDVYSGSGVDYSFAAGRLSYVLGLQGPSMVVATACSSSLVATHLACQSLRSGESQLALAGGVSLILTPEATLYSCRIRSMAMDGRCKTFDAAADGYVRGEGCGIVVLKRLANAVRDGDRILALIRGSAMNHDGKSAGLTVPNAAAQQAVIRSALSSGGVHPSQVGYVEAHGTGTPLGDPIEVRSLWSVLGEGRAPENSLVIGSAKTNFGHLEAAAGAAGLIKTVLALQHREIPPHLHLVKPSANIDWASMQVEIPNALRTWPADNVPAIAGVSSFGLSGMNSHVVLEQAPAAPAVAPAPANEPKLLPLSARTSAALRSLAGAYCEFIDANTVSVRDVCFSASQRRSHLETRLAIVGATAAEMRDGLERYLQRDSFEGDHARHRKIAFVFPGQGGQYVGMARQLLASEPVFRQAVEECDEAFRAHGNWNLLELLERGEGWETEIHLVQPALFAVQIALAALWRSWGIQPDGVIGHSMGEVAAAHVAGILSLAQAAQIICRRSALLAGIRGRGGMLVVELSFDEAMKTITGSTLEVAASNGPRTTVLAGDVAAIESMAKDLESRGVFCRRVQVDVASHSRQVEPLEQSLHQALEGIRSESGTISMYSTVMGAVIDDTPCDRGYWMRNVRERVRFWESLQAMAADGFGVFVELTPHPVLGPSMEEGLRSLKHDSAVRTSMRRGEDDRKTMLETLGVLYERGHAIEWQALYPEGGNYVDLPRYPWQRERYWIASPDATQQSIRTGGHPLLGHHHEFSEQPGTHIWQLQLSTERWTYLADHRVEGLVVVPAAVYMQLASAAAAVLFGEAPLEFDDVRFQQMLVLPQTGHADVQVVLHRKSDTTGTFQIASRSPRSEKWAVHVSGKLRAALASGAAAGDIEKIQALCPESIESKDYYSALQSRGLDYGPAFQIVDRIWRRDGEAISRLHGPSMTLPSKSNGIHPIVLDACFQCLGAALPRNDDGSSAPALPVGFERFQVFKPFEGALWSHSRVTANGKSIEGELTLLDNDGIVVAQINGFRVQPLERSGPKREVFADWLFDLKWQPSQRAEAQSKTTGSWLVFADRQGLGHAFAQMLRDGGDDCTVVSSGELDPLDVAAFRQLLKKTTAPCRGLVHFWGLDLPSPTAIAETVVCMSVVHLVQALTTTGWRDMPRLSLITRGAQSIAQDDVPCAPEQATLWGLGRTIAMEHSELACTCIDLDSNSTNVAATAEALCAEIQSADREDQIVLRSGTRYVPRLTRQPLSFAADMVRSTAGDRPFRLEIDTPGILDKLTLKAAARQAPAPGQVEIEVRASGVNFLDVLSAMGIRPDTVDGPIALGGECAGVVVNVGDGVHDLKIGDPVIALAPFSFGTHVTTDALLVVRKPGNLSDAEAAAIPVVFLTAYYALIHLGRLSAGERILIHSASGGTGLAAVQLAKRVGAEIYATAGNAEKRAFLESLGIRHVMDSRSLAFADAVMEATAGKGVAVVLNSLAGDAIERSLAVLAPYGRFLEIGKKDIYQNSQIGLQPFQKNLSYFAVDLARMIPERPQFVHQMFQDIVNQFASGSLRALRVTAVPIADAATAFHTMAQAKHLGKIVLTFDRKADAPIAAPPEAVKIDENKTYAITGGLGGLGLLLAEWLTEQGARHLLLIGRRGPTPVAEATIAKLRASGATVVVAAADIADRPQLARAINQPSLPALGGVIHAAAVLEDSTLQRLDATRFESVLRPKVDGAWNLHELTSDQPLDFFVLFSSAASVMGSPGQANYSAANAYLDALAHYRRSRGMTAMSINWGPWAEAGLAAAQANRGERLASQGMASIRPKDGLKTLEHLLAQNPVQATVMPFNVRHWRQLFPRAMRAPFLADLLDEGENAARVEGSRAVRAALENAMLNTRVSMLEAHLTEQICQVLRLPAAELGRETPLPTLGLDSLMALELRNRLELSLGVTLSATLIWGYPTIAALTPFLLDKMELAGEVAAPGAESELVEAQPLAMSAVAAMSDDAAAAMLSARLASLDEEYQ
jgi:acyl transferase domain-containing protein/NAD(P)-dependent dehydrogenase (short-subunit alcohol dehydrogenase family)